MALYQKITITDAGAELISGIILNGGSPLTFEAVAVGSGELAEGVNTATFTGLIQEAKRLPIETVTQQGGIITVTARLATDTITADLYHREVGVYANGILLAYGNTGDKYDYIPTAGSNAAVQKIIRVPLAIGNMQTAFAEMDTTDLVTHAALEARVVSIVEPAIREIVTPEIAQEAFNDAVRDIAREAAEEGAADAYAAQVKAEAAAAEALVSEAKIKSVADIVEHADIVWDINKMFGNSTDTYREFYAISALRQYFHEIDVANGDTDPATGFNYSKKFMVPGLKIRYLRGVSNGYIPEPFWCTTTWTGGNIDWSWVPGTESITDDFSNPLKWMDDVPMHMMDIHLDGESTDSTGALVLHVTPEEKATWNEAAAGGSLYEPGEYKTANGMQNFVARCFEIKKPVSGIVEQISFPFRTSTDIYDTTYRENPVYLSVFEQNASGEWEHLGMSTNAITQDIGATGNYAFDKLPLSGRPIRLIVVTAQENTQFDTSLNMGVRVATSTDGAAYTESSLTPVSNYLISATFSGMYLKYTPAAHARDTTIHTTASEKATYKAKADWLDSKDRYQAAFWRDSSGELSTNYLMCLKGNTKRVSLYCKATPQTWSEYILLKAEIIFPKGKENDITITPDETDTKDQLIFDITTSAEATEKNYLIHFEVIYLGAGTNPMYMSSMLRIEAAL